MTYDNKKATLELGTKPVGTLLWQYALPAIAAMTASSLYNIIDRIFIGQIVGPDAIAGLAITFPFMNLAAAFGAAVGVGASTAISMKLGQKDYATAENFLGNTITLNLVVGIGFTIISFIFLNPILRFFGASPATLPYAREFMEIILLGNTISHMYHGMNGVLRAASKPKVAMYLMVFTVIMNILLDVVFILWWGWGIRGAALATVISQAMGMLWQFHLFSNKRELLHLKRGIYKLKSHLVKSIIGIGISPFLMNVCASIVVIFVNHQLLRYGGDMVVGAYGISNAVATVFVLIVMGTNQGMQPIAGYNFGAQRIDRLKRLLTLTIIWATVIMTVGWACAVFFPETIARFFTHDEELVKQSVAAIRYNMLVFPIIGYQMVVTNFFQCIGKVKISIFLSLTRQLLFLLPLLDILPLFFGLNGVWYALPASDVLAWLTALIVMLLFLRKINKQLTP